MLPATFDRVDRNDVRVLETRGRLPLLLEPLPEALVDGLDRPGRGEEMIVAGRALVESYAVLTRLPAPPIGV